MLQRSILLSLCVVCGVTGVASPAALAQAVVPYTTTPDMKELQQTGLALLREALQLAQFQQFEPALARTRLATQLLPSSSEAWALLGGLYLSTDKLDLGIQALEKSLTLNPTNAGVNFSLGSAYFRKANYTAAERALLAGLKIKPDVAEALFDLGNTYLRMNRLDDAVKQYKAAAAKDQKFWPAINNIGLVQYEQGNIEGAIQNWKAAIAIDDKSGEPKLALAVALYKKGQVQEGVTLATAALALDRRYGDIKFLEENLWGDRLIADAKMVLALPQVRETLAELSPAPVPAGKQSSPVERVKPKP